MSWGTPEEVERRNRIRIALWAYAYEFEDDPLVPDHVFDAVALQIRPHMSTGNLKFDRFFAAHFDPSTGMWIHQHPDKKGLARLYARLKDRKCLPVASTSTQGQEPENRPPQQLSLL